MDLHRPRSHRCQLRRHRCRTDSRATPQLPTIRRKRRHTPAPRVRRPTQEVPAPASLEVPRRMRLLRDTLLLAHRPHSTHQSLTQAPHTRTRTIRTRLHTGNLRRILASLVHPRTAAHTLPRVGPLRRGLPDSLALVQVSLVPTLTVLRLPRSLEHREGTDTAGTLPIVLLAGKVIPIGHGQRIPPVY